MDNKARFERIEADLTEVVVILHKFSRTSKQQASALELLQKSQERTQLMLEEIAELVRGIAQGRINGRKHNK